METIKRSRKSKMKKRPEDWEQLKQEVAAELGLWDQVRSGGWSSLSAEDSGRLGGVFSARKKALQELEAADKADMEIAGTLYAPSRDFNPAAVEFPALWREGDPIISASATERRNAPSAEEVVERENFPLG